MRVASYFALSVQRICAIAGLVSIVALCACASTPPPPPPKPVTRELPPAPHQLAADLPEFLTLPNQQPKATPVRVGVVLPFNDSSPGVRALASAMMKAAELALYDSKKADIVLMMADDDGSPAGAAASVKKLLDQGAEIIIGPIFSASVAAVAPLAKDRGVPVLAFSTDRSVASPGVFLLSFQPQSEVERVIAYAQSQGHKKFAALIPQTAYGTVVERSFREAVTAGGGTVADVEHFSPSVGALADPVKAVAATGSDALFIPQGGSLLRGIVPTLAYAGVDNTKVKYLGTGLWDDDTNLRETLLSGGWFAAPQPSSDAAFDAEYKQTFGAEPPQLASLSYDAVQLIALLSTGKPYHRFTFGALTDPNGFAGVNGIFRFRDDGTIERGLAVLQVDPAGFTVVSPAPTTFQHQGS
ncbi:MAG: penicillin-binding protein activator [Alphaproteobacteria bacterium]|nr:penicillin-binding protein activator [Alphaproteobacteria bacterium]